MKAQMKGISLMIILLMLVLTVQAAALRGTVTDKATKEPLIGAAVQLSGTNTGTITDVDGNFELAGLRNGTYKLIISYVSYCTQTVEVTINGMFEIKVELEQDNQQLGEVVVVADAKKNTENAIITQQRTSLVDKMEAVATITSEELNHAGEEAEIGEHTDIKDGMKAVMAGMVTSKRTLITKSNKMMAFLVLEDLYGVSEVVVFPNVYERAAQYLQSDSVVAVRGTVNFKEDEAPKLLADSIEPLDSAAEANAEQKSETVDKNKLIKLKIPSSVDVNITLGQIKETLERHHGDVQVLIYLPEGKILRTTRDLWGEITRPLANQLIAILGYENVKM